MEDCTGDNDCWGGWLMVDGGWWMVEGGGRAGRMVATFASDVGIPV